MVMIGRQEGLMAERGGLHRALELPGLYTAFQRLVSRTDDPDDADLYPELANGHIRVLDIGCGPAAFYRRHRHSGELDYVGIEPNRKYVDQARQEFPEIQVFHGDVSTNDEQVEGDFDLIVLEGVMHHIDDRQARQALALGRDRLRPTGRLVALDPVLLPRQNPIARGLARLDRGKHVRTMDAYRSLAGEVFPPSWFEYSAISGRLRLPYDHALLVVQPRERSTH